LGIRCVGRRRSAGRPFRRGAFPGIRGRLPCGGLPGGHRPGSGWPLTGFRCGGTGVLPFAARNPLIGGSHRAGGGGEGGRWFGNRRDGRGSLPAGRALEVGARGEVDDPCHHQKHHARDRDCGYTPLPSRRRPRLVGRGGGDARRRPSWRTCPRFPQGVLEKAHTIPPDIASAARRISICDTQATNRQSRLAIPGLSDSDSSARLTSLRPISAPPRK